VAGGRAVLSGRLPGLLDRRLALHLPDPLDLTLAGVPPELAARSRPPGRAIDLRTGREVQLAAPGPGPGAIADAVERIAVERRDIATGPTPAADGRTCLPWRITALPERVDVDDLPPARDRLWVGVGGDDAAPLALALGAGRRRILVTGTNRSGRSSALATIGEQLLGQGRHVAVVSPRRSPLSRWATTRECLQLSQHDATDLIAVRRDDPDVCLLVDDAELVDGSPVEAPLVEAARLVDGTDGVVVVASELARANGAFRGLVPEVSRDGVGILLGATSPGDGDVLGARLDPGTIRRAGRGHLVIDGRATPVQVAQVDPERCRPTDSSPIIGPALPLS